MTSLAARDAWIRRLTDMSRRNSLLYYRDLDKGTLRLDAEGDAFEALLRGDAVPVERCVRAADAETAVARCVHVRRRAQANLEDRGIDTLHVAIGLATWTVDDGRPPQSPVLLLPVRIDVKPPKRATLQRRGHAQLNLVLLHALAGLGAAAATADDDSAEELASREAIDAAFAALEATCEPVPGFRVDPAAILGNFAFQKMALVRDLLGAGEMIDAHGVAAALAGDAAARAELARPSDPAAARNERPADLGDEPLILDADATQRHAIARALAPMSGVIQGPPGTGKSQTIANLIACAVARGLRVLFVAEKRAALDAVKKRLDATGLGHLALDLHGTDVSRKEIAARLARSLERMRTPPREAPDEAALDRRLAAARDRLDAHVRRTHDLREPWGLPVFAMRARVLETPEAARTPARWDAAALNAMAPERAAAVLDLATEASRLVMALRRDGASWEGAELASDEAPARALAAAREAAPQVGALVPALKASGVAATTLGEAIAAVTLLADVERASQDWRLDVFALDLAALRSALRPEAGAIGRALAFLTDAQHRAARRTAAAHRVTPRPSWTRVVDELASLQRMKEAWRQSRPMDGAPRVPPHAAELHAAMAALQPALATLRAELAGWDALGLAALADRLARLAADERGAHVVRRARVVERPLREAGASAWLDEVLRSSLDPALWRASAEHALWTTCLSQLMAREPELATFDGREHDATVAEFRAADRLRLQRNAALVARRHAAAALAARNAHPEQDAIVARELAKSSRHLPLRELATRAPDVLLAMQPCLLASPLSVSQLLPLRGGLFDLVVFDEASQVPPEDAVPALLRGRHAIVAGDSRQLPPTAFFAAGEEEDTADAEGTQGVESLLDAMGAIVEPWPLDWHYRSRDERLIAFSDRHFYQRLVTFPGVGREPPVRLVHVADEGGDDADSGSAEVRRVVELVLEHARTRPGDSLGVIALGIPHAVRLQAAIDRAMAEHPELGAFFDEARDDRFFVKNLERVQGDERDAIILSVGYRKGADGKLRYFFGPLSQQGGERRLNVAITRARESMTVVSTFTHLDMDAGRARSLGVQLLRAYLEYCASGGDRADGEGAEPADAFESAMREALAARGMPVVAQWGVGSRRVALAAPHADAAGFVLAIETDGAAYAADRVARDRDRLHAQQLESLGWRFLRAWSSDWMHRPDEEAARMIAAWRAADAGAPEPVVAEPAAPYAVAPSVERGARPAIARSESIDDYTERELLSLARWIVSDGLLRTEAELGEALFVELRFSRRGPRIVERLERVARETLGAR